MKKSAALVSLLPSEGTAAPLPRSQRRQTALFTYIRCTNSFCVKQRLIKAHRNTKSGALRIYTEHRVVYWPRGKILMTIKAISCCFSFGANRYPVYLTSIGGFIPAKCIIDYSVQFARVF